MRADESEGDGIHTVAASRWAGAVVEDMAQVGVAAGALVFDSGHAKGGVQLVDYILFGDGGEEAGPAGTGIEFGLRIKQGCAAADAAVDALRVVLVQLAGEGSLGASLAGDLEFGG